MFVSSAYFAHFDVSLASAVFPAPFRDRLRFDGATVQDVVQSQIKGLPPFHVKWVSPSGRFPSVVDKPKGSSVLVISIDARAFFTRLLASECRPKRPAAFEHDRPCLPNSLTLAPHLHVYGLQIFAPMRKPQTILKLGLSSFSPREVTGTEWTQQEAFSEEVDRRMAFSSAFASSISS